MKQKKKHGKEPQSTRELMGIQGINDYGISTKLCDLVFFIIKPTNISVLPDASVSARINALLNVIKGQTDIEIMAMNSTESFESNKNYYKSRLEYEELPAIRELLELDSNHLDRIQALMSSAREFYIVVRLHNERETKIYPFLANIEKNIQNNGFITRRAGDQDIKRMLGVYFEQNVTTERYEDYDGDRWIIFGE